MDQIKELEAKIADLNQENAGLQEQIAELDQPQFKGMRPHVSDGAAGYFGGATDEVISFEADDERQIPEQYRKARRKGYAPGYDPRETKKAFGGFGGFLKSGLQGHQLGEWQTKHKSLFAPTFKAVQGMSEQVGADGGFLVPPEYSAGILERVYTNNLFSQTDNYTVMGNQLVFTANAETSRANGSRAGGIRGYWGAEGASMTKSNPTFRQISMRLKKLHVLVYLTEEMIEDGGPAVEQYVERKAADEFNFLLGDAVFNGNGTGQPLGIHNSGALVSVAKESGQAADSIVIENIDKMWMRRAQGNGYAWYHNRDCSAQLDRLSQDVGTGGLPLNRPNGIYGAATQTLKGAPRVETEFNETVGDQGDLTLADLSQVLSISKGGISQEASIHVEFLTDQKVLKFTMRVDARPWDYTPTTPYKGSNTTSPFVVVAARA